MPVTIRAVHLGCGICRRLTETGMFAMFSLITNDGYGIHNQTPYSLTMPNCRVEFVWTLGLSDEHPCTYSLSKSPYCDSMPSHPQCKDKASVNKPLPLVYGGRLASSQTTAYTSCGPCGVRNTVNCLLVSVVLGWCFGLWWVGVLHPDTLSSSCIRMQRGVKTLVSKKRRFRSALSQPRREER